MWSGKVKKKKKIVFVFVLMRNTILRSPYAEMCLFYTMEDKIRMFKKKKKSLDLSDPSEM